MATAYNKHKKIKLFLLATIVLSIGGIIGIYIGVKRDSTIPGAIPASEEPGATLSIGKIHQTATRKGKKEWSLEASSAHFIEKTSQMVLKDLHVIFFLKDNSEITLAADQGILKTDSNDIEVFGHVVLKNEEYKLLTENLKYAHRRRVLYSNVPVTIYGTSAHIVADSISFDLNSNNLTLEGSVKTTVDQNFRL
jgi:LPS export ABC transporter protein LptC